MEHREEGVVYVGGMFFSNLSQQLSLSTGADPSFNNTVEYTPSLLYLHTGTTVTYFQIN